MYTRVFERTIYPGREQLDLISLSHTPELLKEGISDRTDHIVSVNVKIGKDTIKMSRKVNGNYWYPHETEDYYCYIGPDTGEAKIINDTSIPMLVKFKVTLGNHNKRSDKLPLRAAWKVFLLNRKK